MRKQSEERMRKTEQIFFRVPHIASQRGGEVA